MSPIPTDMIIFAIDDDRDDIDLLRLLLRKTSLPNPLQVFRSGEQAVNAFTKLVKQSLDVVKPLLCFIDVKLPAMSGHELLRWMRGQPALDRLPVVMLSASGNPRDVQLAAQDGAQCYLEKYPQPRLLKDIVEDAHRFCVGAPAEECFRIPSNLLLVKGRRLTPPKPARPPVFFGSAVGVGALAPKNPFTRRP